MPIGFDRGSYRTCHLVENLFVNLKHFRSVATRYCKLACCYSSFISLVRWVIYTRPTSRSARIRANEANQERVTYWRQGVLDLCLDEIKRQGRWLSLRGGRIIMVISDDISQPIVQRT